MKKVSRSMNIMGVERYWMYDDNTMESWHDAGAEPEGEIERFGYLWEQIKGNYSYQGIVHLSWKAVAARG